MGDMSNMGESPSSAQVLVAGRVRPLITSDRSNGMVCAQALPQAQQIILGNKCFQFPVDYAFPMESSQSQIFETAVQPLMDRLLQGFDTSVVTHGQPTSGKTYTMLGPGVAFHISETEYGIIPRATRYIFSRMKQGPPKKFQVKVSFVNIHNEMLRDLLTSSQYQQELALVESDAGYPVVTGLQEIECETIEVLYNCLHVGIENRQLEWNNARQAGRPAQAHSIFTLSLEQQWVTPEGTMEQRLSIARFADLASSEKIYFRGMGGHVMGETVHMDPGLIALGKVIQSISQPSEWMCYETAKEVYRQSTLTRILKESFGGRSYSLVICCISPALPSFDESLVTLQFAAQLSQIRNCPVMNALSVKVNNVSHDMLQQNGPPNPSGEEGTGDTFGLEFATTQWIKLVASAEGLFTKLVKSNTLSKQERDEIEKWLCLKHECEECVGSDDEDAASVGGNDGRLLEKIDEVTETEEKTDSSKEADVPENSLDNIKYDSESESETESDSQKPDFIDKLDKYIKQFKEKTDKHVNSQQDKDKEDCAYLDNGQLQDVPGDGVTQHPVRNCLPNNGRRRSIHPGTQLPLMALGFNTNPILDNANITVDSEEIEGEKTDNNDQSADFALNYKENTEQQGNQQGPKQDHMDPHQQLKLLLAGSEAKQNQVKQVALDIESTQKRIEELQATISEKEQFIQDIHNNADTRASAKKRFQERKTKLEEEYYKTCQQVAQIQSALYKTASHTEENTKCRKEKEKYERKVKSYEQRLKSMDIIKQIAGDSAKKVLELEKSLQSSKRLMEKLNQRLRKEEVRKVTIENNLVEDQEKIKELLEICNNEANKNDGYSRNPSTGGSKDGDLRWIKEEEERQVNMRESSQRLQENLQRDALVKEKISLEKQQTRKFLEYSARISHLDQVLKEKSTDLEKLKDEDEKQSLRLEIHNLRSTRDCLIDERCALDDKFQQEKSLTTLEERKLLECDEAIEAIDAAIEYKNELICGRKSGFEAGGRGKGEELLMARLNKLSDDEMRMLLYKYFLKVIDLRESGRKLEVQLTEKEGQNDQQTWQIQTLTNAIRQYRLEAERQIILLQRQHQEKLHLMLRTFADESSGGGGASSGTDTLGNQSARIDKEEQISLKAENRRLQRRLQDLESTLQKLQGSRKTNTTDQVGHSHKDPRCRSPSPEPVRPPPEPIPNKSMKQLRAAATALTTKVTRQKNKLIIQQQKPPDTSNRKQTNN